MTLDLGANKGWITSTRSEGPVEGVANGTPKEL